MTPLRTTNSPDNALTLLVCTWKYWPIVFIQFVANYEQLWIDWIGVATVKGAYNLTSIQDHVGIATQQEGGCDGLNTTSQIYDVKIGSCLVEPIYYNNTQLKLDPVLGYRQITPAMYMDSSLKSGNQSSGYN